jgi:hypothetical protein
LKITQTQRLVLISLLTLISGYYFLSSCYINTSNDGSHFALVSALVKRQSVVINEFVQYTGKIDYAVKDGKFYSDRLPGNAFLLIPFYAFGSFLEFTHLYKLSSHRPIQEITVILLPNVCGMLGALFCFLFSILFGASFKLSAIVAGLFGLCTLNVQESTHIFSHAPSMLFVLAAFYLLIASPSIYHKNFLGFIILLSYSTIIELQNALLFLPAALYVYQSRKIAFGLTRKTFITISKALGIFCSIISILLVYNYVAFGELTLKSNKYNPEFPEERTFLTSLSGNVLAGLDALLTNFSNMKLWMNLKLGVQNDIPGLLIASPILFLSLIGFIFFFKKFKNEALLFSFIILFNILTAAFHKTVLTRHIFTITPFLLLPIVFFFQEINQLKNKFFAFVVYCTTMILSAFSAYRAFYITHSYWGRDITNIFPFKKEMGIYLVFLFLIAVIFFIIFTLRKLLFSKTRIS